ncbi:multidrug effflux MFS transporter [Sulfitobacter donghicola]|uniref:Bcr/CflA family efflux transporter n=1 Tax=Sulfitobacter donghicola DSW-25 = KCTC 12864 = JCM 14565 TaxID=1300350 RepID=A0A073IHU3_9RHOB|nr:multidrug effflux MFS transporter [Sulfitobacter donghicola]KEJ89913.1 multidrug MFS transporter [Sulfitobacter donghicola DSW-25 = KCTC 12864 = JCM 14565]KIN66962.1 MFS protein [Sulfitobacter donghicola DSW-25 = KCTC 12864 = JCM 14565]
MQAIREDLRAVKLGDRNTPPHAITLVVLAGMSACAMNMFLPSLPAMATHFETDYAVMQLSVAIYLGFSAVLQIFAGPISDKYGRRPVVLWGLAIFLIATVGCIYAPTIEVFLFFRMTQAAVATSMALSRAAVRDMYAQDQAASIIGYVTMGMAIVPMISPALGGLLDEWFGWQVVFWALFTIGGITFLMALGDMGETARPTEKSLTAQFAEYPELIRSQRFWGYALASGFCSGAFFAYLGGAPFVGREVFGMSPSVLGFYFGAPAIGYFVGNFITGRYAIKFGVNRMIFWGCIANALGGAISLSVFLAGYGTPLVFFGMMTLVGLGNGLCIPNATAGMLSVRPHLAGTASGFGGAIMIGGGAGLSAWVGVLLTPQTGAFPLLWMMLITSLLGLLSILTVIRREKVLSRHS